MGNAQNNESLLITTDKGFVHHRSELHCGVLVVRSRQPNEQKIHERVMQAVQQFSRDNWSGLIVVMRDVVQSIWQHRDADTHSMGRVHGSIK